MNDIERIQELADDVAAPKGNGNADDESKASTSTLLVELAQERYNFGVSILGETYAIQRSGPKVVRMLRGDKSSLRSELARLFFQRYRRIASQQALADALLVIEGIAQEAQEQELHLRVAGQGDCLWLDLGDNTGTAIKVSSDGWTVEETAPVLFKRTKLMNSLPEPESGGSLEELWNLLNVTEPDRSLVAAWLVAALLADIPHPVLMLTGEQGSGKTSAQRMLVAIIDPSPVPTRKAPRDPEAWVTAAQGSWVVGLDNLSVVQDWLSDSICRAVTGDGDVRRRLYTDGEHAVFAFRRCIVLNGIDLGALRGDLAERMLPIHLDTIAASERRDDREVSAEFSEAHPRLLGALLDLTVSVLGELPEVKLEMKPRMADFARIVAAVGNVLGTNAIKTYALKLHAQAVDSLTGDPLIVELLKLQGKFEGTSSELLDQLATEKTTKGWPTNARAVTQRLKRHAPALRKAGWSVSHDDGQNRGNALKWTINPPEIARNPDSQGSHTREKREGASVARVENGQSQDYQRCLKCDGEGCRRCEKTQRAGAGGLPPGVSHVY